LRSALTLPALLLVAWSAPLQSQDFEGVVVVKVKSGTEMTIYAKCAKTRMEFNSGQGQMAMIMDPVAGENLILIPSQSMYMVMKQADVEKVTDTLKKRAAAGTMTALNKKEKVAGYSCDLYRYQDPKEATDVCIATGLGTFRPGAAFFSGPPARGKPADVPPWARELMQKGAFPLKVTDTLGVRIMEVISLEQKKLDASLFVPPADYHKMPSFGRPPE
jgi:hypothetical protein